MMAEEEELAGAETVFQVYGHTLVTVKYFCYLGRILNATDNECPKILETSGRRSGTGRNFK